MITLHGEFKGIPTANSSGTIVRGLSVPVKINIYNAGLEALKLSTLIETIIEPGESSGDMFIAAGETLYWSGITKFQWKIYFDQNKIPFGGQKDRVKETGVFLDEAETTTLIYIKNSGATEPIQLFGKYSEKILPGKEITLLMEKGNSLSWETSSFGEFQIAEVGHVMEFSLTETNFKAK